MMAEFLGGPLDGPHELTRNLAEAPKLYLPVLPGGAFGPIEKTTGTWAANQAYHLYHRAGNGEYKWVGRCSP